MKKYEKLKTQYPAYISLEQLRGICKIAKRSARYLVDNGIIPAIDTGRKTWRYKISIDDVTEYLRRRDREGSMIPAGATSSREPSTSKRSYSQVVSRGQEREAVKYFAEVYADYPDVLSTDDMAAMAGMHKKSLMRILKDGHIKVLASKPRYVVPKVYFWDFIASRRFIDAWSNSDEFSRILEGFEEWRQNR
jgi:hypothetical protein